MKWADFIIIGIVAAIALFSFLFKLEKANHLYLFVKTEHTTNMYQLNQYKKITNEGPLGLSILVISNRSVFMQSSPCPLHICIQEGHINKANQSVFCIPNKIEATILSSNFTEVDSVAR